MEVYHASGMQACFRLVYDYKPMCVYWKYKLQHASIVQEHKKIARSAGEGSCWGTAYM